MVEHLEGKQDVVVGEWVVLDAVPAIDGWKALLFVDPDQPVERRIAMWASCYWKATWIEPEEVDERIMKHVHFKRYHHERRYLPMFVSGGALELADDADAIMGPSMSTIQLQAELCQQQLQ